MPRPERRRPMPGWRRAAAFVAVSGLGWLADTTVFLALSGLAAWPLLAANLASGSVGALFVFATSSRAVFRANDGPVLPKLLALLAFNAAVILAGSVLLAALADLLRRTGLPPPAVPLAAKILVTPATLVLNFLVVRYLLERFVGMQLRPRIS